MPQNVLENENYPPISKALNQIHFPDTTKDLEHARDRFAFEEIFFLQLGVMAQKTDWCERQATAYPLCDEEVRLSASRLPYQLTNAQQQAIQDILYDLNSGHPMNRLLQGDVGSGKNGCSQIRYPGCYTPCRPGSRLWRPLPSWRNNTSAP